MKKHLSIFAIAAVTLTACASSTKKFDYPLTTNATAEIDRLETEMSTALRNQVNVTAPNEFADARKKLDEAKKENQNRSSNADVLEDLGYARAHLDAANESAPRVETAIPEVTKARTDALTADAMRLRNADLIDADSSMKKVTENFEHGKNPSVSVEKRGELQKKYLDLELASIKMNYLGQAQALIETAKKMNAEKYGKATLASAQAKYQTASRTIETDRHNSTAIAQAAEAATAEAKHAVEITRLAKGMKEQSPEESAIAMDAKRNEAARNAAETEKESARLQVARGTIQDKNTEIAAIGSENSKLEQDKKFNDAFTTAQQSFSKDEAEVYRQGDNLIVRLKQMQFSTGRSELPDSSLPVLNKVKDVIASMGANKVTVEGHTDAVGSHAQNQVLSEKRADAIAKYFTAESVLPADQIEVKGYGDTKPLTTNKTKVGRAQNRRVDIVISKPQMGMTDDKTPTSNSAAKRPSAPASDATAPQPKHWEE